MQVFIQLIVHLLPDSILDQLQEAGLKELDRRGLIIWADKETILDLSQLEAFRGD